MMVALAARLKTLARAEQEHVKGLERRFISALFVETSFLEQRFDFLAPFGEKRVHLRIRDVLVERERDLPRSRLRAALLVIAGA